MRKHYIDNIRWTTVILVLIYHVFYMFNHAGVFGGIKPLEGAEGADVLLYFVYPWFMALLFLLAGMSARYALSKRTAKQFIGGRVTKLLVPSTLGLFVFQWLGGYLNVKIGGGLDTIPPIARYPIFALSGTGPLWFIQLLFLFSLLLIPIKKLDASDRLWTLCKGTKLPVLLLLAIPVWGASQILNAPVITTYRFGIYFVCFLLGYFVFSHDEVTDRLQKARLPMLIAAVTAGVLYTVYFFGENYTEDACLKHVFTSVYLWLAILAIIGCSKAWFNKENRLTAYMNRVSFGWYIVHYPVLLAVCFALVNFIALPSAAVYILALVIYVPLTAAVYELLRRIPFVRWAVLGIKKRKEEKKTAEEGT